MAAAQSLWNIVPTWMCTLKTHFESLDWFNFGFLILINTYNIARQTYVFNIMSIPYSFSVYLLEDCRFVYRYMVMYAWNKEKVITIIYHRIGRQIDLPTTNFSSWKTSNDWIWRRIASSSESSSTGCLLTTTTPIEPQSRQRQNRQADCTSNSGSHNECRPTASASCVVLWCK